MDPTVAFEFLSRLTALLRAEERRVALEFGLQPAHLHALRYLAQANRYSDTPAAVTEYLGATKGTISQTLLVLRERGLLAAAEDPKDRRRTHLRPTPEGRRVLEACSPPPGFRAALAGMPEEAGRVWEDLLRRLQRENGGRTFGVCATCAHLRPRPGGRATCGLTGEPLRRAERQLLCREHEPAAPGAT